MLLQLSSFCLLSDRSVLHFPESESEFYLLNCQLNIRENSLAKVSLKEIICDSGIASCYLML